MIRNVHIPSALVVGSIAAFFAWRFGGIENWKTLAKIGGAVAAIDVLWQQVEWNLMMQAREGRINAEASA